MTLLFYSNDAVNNCLSACYFVMCSYVIFFCKWLFSQRAILALDTSVLDNDQVENLIKFCPTNEEIEMLKVLLNYDSYFCIS
jgi:hypothetical protein